MILLEGNYARREIDYGMFPNSLSRWTVHNTWLTRSLVSEPSNFSGKGFNVRIGLFCIFAEVDLHASLFPIFPGCILVY